MLALEPNRVVPLERLVDGLWGERPPASATKMVQHYVSHLRRLLDGADAEIVTHGRGYELRVAPEAIDVARFERLIEHAEGEAALVLWRGKPLADVAAEPFAGPEIDRLEELEARAAARAVEAEIGRGDHDAALARLERLIRAHPLRERLHAQRMRALYRAGRQAEALAAFVEIRRALVEEIGAEPGPELQRLHAAVLRQDPALDRVVEHVNGVEAPAAPAVAARSRRAGRRRLVAGLAAVAVPAAVVALVLGTRSEADLTALSADTAGAVDPESGRLTSEIPAGRSPSALAVGDGRVWIASAADRSVVGVDPSGTRAATLPLTEEPAALAAAAGSLWVAVDRGRDVLQLDPGSDRVVRRIEVGNSPVAIAAGEGAVWVASAVDRTVSRIDPSRGAVTARIDLGASPTALAVGGGAVWVASEESGAVFRIEPRTAVVTATLDAGNGPSALAADAGALWVANRQDDTVWRIDPATRTVTDTLRVGAGPVAVALGAGAVWVAGSRAGTLTRIDPAARRVDRTIALGNAPAGVGVAGGRVWTAVAASPSAHRGGTLIVADDVACCEDAEFWPWEIGWLAYDGLVGYRRTGGSGFGRLTGDLAEAVPEPAADGRTYVFKLREGIRYSDGSPVRAADVRASLESQLALNGFGMGSLARIRGARRCMRSSGPCDLSAGVVTDDRARTITIRLTAPDSELLHALASPPGFVTPAGRGFGEAVPPPGTGPYRFGPLRRMGHLRLIRNPHFRVWSEDARPDGIVDEIVFRVAQDGIAAVESGDADVAQVADAFGTDAGPAALAALRARAASRLYTSAAPSLEFLFLDVRRPPFDDVRVRHAFNLAVDRGHVADLSGGPDLARPTCQLVPPGAPGFAPRCRYTRRPDAAGSWTAPDVERAQRLVAASGTAGQRVVLWGYREKAPVLRYLASVLRSLGFRARTRILPDYASSKDAAAASGPVQAGIEGWLADNGAASAFVWPVTCGQNPSRFCDAGLEAAVARAQSTRGPAAEARWREVYARADAAAPIVPLLNRRTLTLVSERVGGYQDHP
ncbi:MAG: ABC transporter substrate-binding protein, partial [Solirubrobacteraceae bacterium]